VALTTSMFADSDSKWLNASLELLKETTVALKYCIDAFSVAAIAGSSSTIMMESAEKS
jgi:hypothetical protein